MRFATLLLMTCLATAAAQVSLELRPPTEQVMSGQHIDLKLVVQNAMQKPLTIGNVMKGGWIPCPTFKVFDKAGGAPQKTNYAAVDCVQGEAVQLSSGQKGVYSVQLPLRLEPGEYIAIMTVPTAPKPQYASVNLRVGPGPFVAQLRLARPAMAGQPLALEVVYRNIWRSTASDAVERCRAGLLIRDEQGRTVYEKDTHTPCLDVVDGLQLKSGGQQVSAFAFPKSPPTLPKGQYTAIMWGAHAATLRFVVK